MAFPLRATEKVSLVNDEDELRKRGYRVGSTLGEGSYAKVKSAISERLAKKVALKIINRKKAPKDFQQKFLPRELEVMRLIDHPHIIKLYEIMQFGGKVYIAMEMAGHGDLLEYIKLRGAIDETKARTMFRQLASAVEYLHSINVVHRDLKCENILLDTNNNVKLSDFGFSRILAKDELSKTFCGSAAYAAPEILQGIPYHGVSYDIWSLGVILYIMVCGSMPYDDSNIKKMIKTQTEKRVGFSRSRRLGDDVKDLIHCMLEADISKRYTVGDIKIHPWQQIYEPAIPQSATSSGSSIKSGSPGRREEVIRPKRLPQNSPAKEIAREIQTAKPRGPAYDKINTYPRNLPPIKPIPSPPKRVQTPCTPSSSPVKIKSEESLSSTLHIKACTPSTPKSSKTGETREIGTTVHI